MLGSGDNTGIITLLIGLVLVVLCGIGISLIADTKLSLGDSKASLQSSLDTDKEKIQKLSSVIEYREQSWRQDHAPLIGQGQQITDLKRESSDNTTTRAELRTKRVDLLSSLKRIEKDTRAYRIQYRTQMRADTVGLKLDTLSLSSGRNYRSVVVRGFDSSGLRIHHQGGSARVSYSELPREMQERLQWHPNETETTKTEPRALKVSDPDESPPEQKIIESPRITRQIGKPKGPSESDIAKISAARENFINTRKAYLNNRSQANTARYKSSDSQKSVPGSLETWAERTVRLDRLSQRLNASYINARRELSSLSPGDPLLRNSSR